EPGPETEPEIADAAGTEPSQSVPEPETGS
ncbi:MAG: hypothetical protein QOH19_238, partial [Actinomycetota bacterium]|nr:hypothetical protein [Actinomycetota bacterium]